MHTNSATQTVDRILDTFSGEQQKQVRVQLVQVLKGVISMQLLEKTGWHRACRGSGDHACDAKRICELIERGETGKLAEEVESSVSFFRMQSMNQSLLALLVHGTISYAEAMRASTEPEELLTQAAEDVPSH